MSKKKQDSSKAMASDIDNLEVALSRKRDMLFSRLSRFESFLVDILDVGPSKSKLMELDTRLKDLERNLLSEYNDVQFQLEGIDAVEYAQTEQPSFESKYYRVISSAKELMYDISNSANPNEGPYQPNDGQRQAGALTSQLWSYFYL